MSSTIRLQRAFPRHRRQHMVATSSEAPRRFKPRPDHNKAGWYARYGLLPFERATGNGAQEMFLDVRTIRRASSFESSPVGTGTGRRAGAILTCLFRRAKSGGMSSGLRTGASACEIVIFKNILVRHRWIIPNASTKSSAAVCRTESTASK